MILVYCNHITNRHRYIFDFIFKDILGLECNLTSDKQEFTTFTGPKINYSNENFPGAIQFQPHSLLDEKGISQQKLSIKPWNPETLEPWNFEIWNPGALDPFALSFYLVTRYEEYLPFTPDSHGRFSPEQSLAYQHNFLRTPLVDVIAHHLKNLLANSYPGLKIPGQPFRFIPSFDIDIAFAHLGKGWGRAAAAWVKLILKADIKQVKERISTLTGKIKDPYDNFDLHQGLAEKFGHQLLYFVLLGNFSKYDRNNSYRSKRFRNLLNRLSLSAEMGLHPSYRSHLYPEVLEEEKGRLGDMETRRPGDKETGKLGDKETWRKGDKEKKRVTKSRFHFLRLKFPDSYRLLISQGITDDYSLGYSTMNGFRASTCTPFLYYDLQKEEITNLRLHPFIFMDSAMIDHLKLMPEAAIREIDSLVGLVRQYGGEAIGIWHNYSLSEKDQYKGWQEVLIRTMEQYQTQRA
jgi:hypothetical protein